MPTAPKTAATGAFAIGLGVRRGVSVGCDGTQETDQGRRLARCLRRARHRRHFRRAHDRNFQRPLTRRPRLDGRLGQGHERLPRFTIQLQAVCLVFAWTGVVAFIAFYIVKRLVALRVPEEEEREGLDITSHGERAYDL
jgi:Ammonium Transporter Family